MKLQHLITFYFILISSIGISIAQDKDKAPNIASRPLFDFEATKPPFDFTAEQQENTNRMLRFTILTGYREGVEPIRGLANFATYSDKKNGTAKTFMYNLSIQDMLTFGFYNSSRVILEVENPKRYRYDVSQGDYNTWMRANAHCFEMMQPIGAVKGAEVLKSELARMLNVKFGLQKRLVDVLILKRTSSKDKLKSAGKGDAKYDFSGRLNNIELNRLITILYEAQYLPLVDETGYTAPVDMDLRFDPKMGIEGLRKELRRYDLDIQPGKREYEMFVITENNKLNNL